MKLFKATIAQAATARTVTAVEVAMTALNAIEAFKSSGAGYNDRSMIKMAADVICNEASVVSIEGKSVTKVGIERLVVPFGVAIRLSNGMGRKLSIVHTSIGTVITERNSAGWKRKILTVNEVREMLVSFTGAQSTAVAATTDLKEVAPTAGRITRKQVQAAVDAARHN